MKKKHPTKKHFTEKYFTKKFVKTNIILISAIGILIGAVVITLSVYFGATSCKSNPTPSPIPSDAKVITENIDDKYIVQSNETIWTSADNSSIQNKLLDLAFYASDKEINTNDFVIKGEIDFGILINFDEDVNLFGYPQSLISLGTQDSPLTTSVYGIIVGSLIQPIEGQDAYHGEMNIDSSVNVSIYSGSNSWYSCGIYFYNVSYANINIDGIFKVNSSETIGCYGIFFYGYTTGGSVDINGVFTINSSHGECCGVYFDRDRTGCNIVIDGMFMIHSSGLSRAYGLVCNGAINSTIDINGVFVINSFVERSGIFAYGVNFVGDYLSSININGIFMITSNFEAFAGYLENVNKCLINIGGIFSVNSTQSGVECVPFFDGTTSDSVINIDGVFTGNGYDEVVGTIFNSVTNCSINIDGVCTLNALASGNGRCLNIYIYGEVTNSTIEIGGTFALNSFNDAIGAYFPTTVTNSSCDTASNPQFFSKKINSDDLFTSFPNVQYKWNGKQANNSSQTTPTDDGLSISPVIARGNPDFWINVITTTMKDEDYYYNQNIFNQAYKDGLNNYLNAHPTCSKNVIGWLRDIINHIPFKHE